MTFLALLKSKNRWLERFLSETLACADALERPGEDIAALLADLEVTRDRCLRAVALIDRKLEAESQIRGVQDFDATARAKLRAIVSQRIELLASVRAADDRLAGFLDSRKTALIKQAATVRASSEKIGKFKSHWVQSAGEELDQKL